MIEPGQLIEQNGLNIGNTINGLVFNLEEFGLNQLDLYDNQQKLIKIIEKQNNRIDELEKKLDEISQ